MYLVNGGWSSWTQGACNKTCGGGIMRFNRTCTNPTPSCGGLPCIGNSTREESCNEFCCSGKFYIHMKHSRFITNYSSTYIAHS